VDLVGLLALVTLATLAAFLALACRVPGTALAMDKVCFLWVFI
jgi:hypothetical protein